MKTSPKVSIITRTRDRLGLLQRALASVQAQTISSWEHVIVNDGGDPAALDALIASQPEAFAGRIRVVHNEQSRGMQLAANQGIGESNGEYICIHDDDDEWAPGFLRALTGFLNKEGKDSLYQGVICSTEEVRERIEEDGSVTELDRRPYIPLDQVSFFRLGYENPFPPIAFCYRRSAWDSLGGYDPRWDVIGDMDFNLRFLAKYEIGVVPKVLAYYRIREASTRGKLANSISAQQPVHKRLFNEFKNHFLRRADTPEGVALAFALNSAGYLVEAQWILHDIFHRTQRSEAATKEVQQAVRQLEGATGAETTRILQGLEQAAEARQRQAGRLEELIASLGLEGKDDRYPTVRAALNILVDHARDPGVRKGLEDLQKGLEQAAEARQRQTGRVEELIASLGLEGEDDRYPTVRAALNILVDHARDPGVRKGLEDLQKGLEQAAEARQRLSGKLERMSASIGSPEKGESGLHSQLAALQALVEQGHKQSGQHFQQVHDESRDTAGSIRKLSDRLDRLEKETDQILQSFEKLHAAQAKVMDRIDSLSENLDRMENNKRFVKVGFLQFPIESPKSAAED